MFQHEMRNPFLSESDRAARVQGSDRESHCIRTYIRIAIYSGFCDEAEATKLCHAMAFYEFYQHLFESIGREEDFHNFALHASFRR